MVPAMAETPDTAALARRWLDLWEDELAAFATDHGLAGPLAGLLAAFARFVPAGRADSGDGGPATPPRPAAASPASGDGAGGLDQFAHRLDALELRLARLERAGKSAAAKACPAKSRPRAKKRGKPAGK